MRKCAPSSFDEIKVTELWIEFCVQILQAKSAPYYTMLEFRQCEMAEFVEQLQQAFIDLAITKWSSPVLIVPNKGSRVQLCVDCRKLSAASPKGTYLFRQWSGVYTSLIKPR